MADNTTLNPGSGGDTIATDDISGVKFPRGKITIGADGVNDGDVSAANPMPASLPSGQQLISDGQILTVKRAAIATASGTTHTLIAAVASKKLRILALLVQPSVQDTVRFYDGAPTTTPLSGPLIMAAIGVSTFTWNPHGHFETAAGNAFTCTTAGSVSVNGSVVYVEV